MAKYLPNFLTSLANPTSAIATINANLSAISSWIEDCLSKAGLGTNQLQTTLDANNNRIINLPAPNSLQEPMRVQDIVNGAASVTIITQPTDLDGLFAANPGAVLGRTFDGGNHISPLSAARARSAIDAASIEAVADKMDKSELRNIGQSTIWGRPEEGTADGGPLNMLELSKMLKFYYGGTGNDFLALPPAYGFPSGFVFQWGTTTGEKTVSFPVTFSTACLNLQVSMIDNNATGLSVCNFNNLTKSGFDAHPRAVVNGGTVSTPTGTPYSWYAVGY